MSDETGAGTTTADESAEQTPAEETSGAVAPAEEPDADAAAGGGGADDLEPAPAATPEHGGDEQSLLDRYVTPIVLPVLIVGILLFYVLNVSRIFLATAGAGAVVAGSVLTLVILAGAAALSAAPGLRPSSLRLLVAGFLFVVLLAGTLTIGESEEEEEAGGGVLAAEGPFTSEVTTGAFNIGFTETQLEAETGIVRVEMTDTENGEHTFLWDDPDLTSRWEKLRVLEEGEVDFGRIFIGEPSEYTFYCDIPGHRAAGMEGVLTVGGEPVTLEEVEAEIGESVEGGGEAEEGAEDATA